MSTNTSRLNGTSYINWSGGVGEYVVDIIKTSPTGNVTNESILVNSTTYVYNNIIDKFNFEVLYELIIQTVPFKHYQIK